MKTRFIKLTENQRLRFSDYWKHPFIDVQLWHVNKESHQATGIALSLEAKARYIVEAGLKLSQSRAWRDAYAWATAYLENLEPRVDNYDIYAAIEKLESQTLLMEEPRKTIILMESQILREKAEELRKEIQGIASGETV